jgi:hypothetical protein
VLSTTTTTTTTTMVMPLFGFVFGKSKLLALFSSFFEVFLP